jgi:hypothetical protein
MQADIPTDSCPVSFFFRDLVASEQQMHVSRSKGRGGRLIAVLHAQKKMKLLFE